MLKRHWIYQHFHVKKDADAKIVHFHYTDNPFLPEHYIKLSEKRKKYDFQNYIRLTLGLWQNDGGLVYPNYDIKESDRGYEYYFGGVDFGFNNPSCFLLLGMLDGEIYVIDEVYKTRLINYEFIGNIVKCLRNYGLNPSNLSTCYCDSAEPDRIEEFCNYGFNALPGVKNVSAKLEAVKSHKLHIAERCTNTLEEISNYAYAKDKEGNDTERPVKFNDHAMDALGYAVHGAVGVSSVLSGKVSNDPLYMNFY